jgi:hypothetical protein
VTAAAVTEEITDGARDGTNTHFRTTYSIVPDTLYLTRNGLTQIPYNCYCELANDPQGFKTATPPAASDVLVVIYRTLDAVELVGEVDVLPGTDRGVSINGARQIKRGSIGVDRLSDDAITELSAGAELTANKGQADGYAPLDANQLVPAIHLPSYMDDVIEYPTVAALPDPGVDGKIYVTIDTNKCYRWSGSVYIQVAPSPGSTDQVAEGALNRYYTDARVDARIAAVLATQRFLPRTSPFVNVASWTINSDACDYAENSGIAAPIVINKPTGSPVPHQFLGVALIPASTTKAITWDPAGFESSSVNLPGTTGTSRKDIDLLYNAGTGKWRCVKVS